MLQRSVALLNRVGPYGLAAATQAGASFLLLPLMLLLIGPQFYGRFALLEPLVAMLAQVLLLGAHQGMLHAICKEDAPPMQTLRRTLWQAQVYMLPLAALGAGLVALWQSRLDVGLLFAGALYLEALNLACLTAARAIGDAWSFFFGTLSKVLIMLSGTLVATGWIGRGVLDERFALGLLGAGTVSSLLLLAVRMNRRTVPGAARAHTETGSLLGHVRYGLPLVSAGLCQSVIAMGDRFILSAFVSPVALTAYVVASKLANAMNLAATPINLWWPTARFEHLKDADGGQAFFRGAAVKVAGIYGVVALMLIAASPWLLPLLGPGVSAEPGIAAALVLAAFLQALQVVLNIGMLMAGQTRKYFYVTGAAAVFHVTGCLLLVPLWGVHGAALMAVATATLVVSAVNFVSQRITPVAQNLLVLGLEISGVALVALAMPLYGVLRCI